MILLTNTAEQQAWFIQRNCVFEKLLFSRHGVGDVVAWDIFSIAYCWCMNACVLFCVNACMRGGSGDLSWQQSLSTTDWYIPCGSQGKNHPDLSELPTLSGMGILSRACQCVSCQCVSWRVVSKCLSFRMHCVPPLLIISDTVITGLTVVASSNVFCIFGP